MAKLRLVLLLLGSLPRLLARMLLNKLWAAVHALTYGGPTANPRTVVVVGGSFAGAQLVRRLTQSLPTGWRVLLVERNSHLNYTFNLPRASVLPGRERALFVPYDSILAGAPRGIAGIVQARVVGMSSTEILLEDAPSLPYDAAVLATGCTAAPPTKLRAGHDRDAACHELHALQQRIRAARTVAVVGGGAAGVELAADARTYADKEVTLVHSRPQLLNTFPPALHDHVRAVLERLGVRVVLGQRPEVTWKDKDAAGTDTAGRPGTLRFADHDEPFDCILLCTGTRPNSAVLHSLAPDAIAPSGEISVAPTLQVLDRSAEKPLANVFAMGDVAATGASKMARSAFDQAEVVVANILALAAGRPAAATYDKTRMVDGIKLTLGKNDAVMFASNGKKSALVPMKGLPDDLEIKKGWSLLGAKYPKDLE